MIDTTDWFDTPKSIVLAVLRALWWLDWYLCVQTVGWSIGWCVLRVLTLGRYPEERLGGVDEAGTYTASLVEVVRLGALAAGFGGWQGALPGRRVMELCLTTTILGILRFVVQI